MREMIYFIMQFFFFYLELFLCDKNNSVKAGGEENQRSLWLNWVGPPGISAIIYSIQINGSSFCLLVESSCRCIVMR